MMINTINSDTSIPIVSAIFRVVFPSVLSSFVVLQLKRLHGLYKATQTKENKRLKGLNGHLNVLIRWKKGKRKLNKLYKELTLNSIMHGYSKIKLSYGF